MQQSFQQLARIVFKDEKAQVVFKDNATPHTEVANKKIVLPSAAKDLPLEKRIELMCYLLHEGGHLTGTTPVSNYVDEDDFLYINLLEDLRIQPSVEKFVDSSRDIYEYTLEKLMAPRIKNPETSIQQKIVDSIILRVCGLSRLRYDSKIDKIIDSRWRRIMSIYSCYNKTVDAIESNKKYKHSKEKIGQVMRKLLEGKFSSEQLGQLEAQKKARNKAVHQADDQMQDRKYEADIESSDRKSERKQKNNESLKRSQQLKNRRNASHDKAERKSLAEALKQEQELRKKLKEELQEFEEEHRVQGTEKYMKYRESQHDLQKARDARRECNASSCTGLNHATKEFFEQTPDQLLTLRQTTSNNMKRLFQKMRAIVLRNESGKLNNARISQFFDEDNIFQAETKRKSVKASVAFLLDSSGSMGGRQAGSRLVTCWNSFANLAKALAKIQTSNTAQIRTEVYGFSHGYETLKKFKQPHSEALLKDMKKKYFEMYH